MIIPETNILHHKIIYDEELNLNQKTTTLPFLASDAASVMEFNAEQELQEAIRRAMYICENAGVPSAEHFKRIHNKSDVNIILDWALSALAYRLVCMCGLTSNPNVSRLIIQLTKEII